MEKINLEDTKIMIGGGISLSGALLSAAKGCITTIMDVGRALGGAIRRIATGNLCKF